MTKKKETEDYYQRLCDQLGIAVVATDSDFLIRVWNTAASRLFGAAADQMLGESAITIIPQEHREMAEQHFKNSLHGGEVVEFEFEHRDHQGQHRILAATVAPIVSQSSERIGLSVSLRDITRRINLEQEVHENEKMVSLGEMAGAVAHHFNNILGGMVTSIDYATTSRDPAIERRVFGQISRSVMRATSLVNGLLVFAEGDKRAEDLSDFTEIINELADQIDEELKDRNIDFDLQLPPLSVLTVPRVQVRTILRNILQNAMEAMPDGGTLRMEISMKDGAPVVRIIDTGVGLDEQTKSRMFEPFWSTKGELTAGAGKATGLGLAVAHGLTQRLGGTITVDSEPDKGSTFTITIPVSTTEQP